MFNIKLPITGAWSIDKPKRLFKKNLIIFKIILGPQDINFGPFETVFTMTTYRAVIAAKN